MNTQALAKLPPQFRPKNRVAGKFDVVALLGVGGMGFVVEARNRVIGRRVALKFLLPEVARNAEAVTRFEREARVAGAIASEHIVAVTDFDVAEDGTPFIVMEFVEGRDLRRVLREDSPLDMERAVRLIIDACRGLDCAHVRGVVHRDLKPENLFAVRREDGTEICKVGDFGIAKLTRKRERPAAAGSRPLSDLEETSGAIAGTVAYMAPEQLREQADIDARADVYGLGVILYEIFAGRPPYLADSPMMLALKVITEAAPPLADMRPDLPKALVGIIDAAMAKNLDDRPPGLPALVEALRPFAGRPVRPLRPEFEGALKPTQPDLSPTISLPPPTASVIASAVVQSDAISPPAWRGWAASLGAVLAVMLAVAMALVVRGGRPDEPRLRSPSTAPPPAPAPVAPSPPIPTPAVAPPAFAAQVEKPLPNPPQRKRTPRPRKPPETPAATTPEPVAEAPVRDPPPEPIPQEKPRVPRWRLVPRPDSPPRAP